jgi:mRNA interferase RelE/StbE
LHSYQIFETEEFNKRLGKLNSSDKIFIAGKLKGYIYPQLINEPHFGKNIKKLVGYTPETWRYRIGRFRLFYFADDNEKIVYMLTLDQRKDIY